VRIQLFVALLVGLVLVATSLYLWRRPAARADAVSPDEADAGPSATAATDVQPTATSAAAAAAAATANGAAGAPDAGSANGISLSEARVLSCKDKGKKTAGDECDHPEELEQAFARAIEGSASCIPTSAGGGTIEFHADVTFTKRKSPVAITVSKKDGSMKNAKALSACGKAVKHALADISVEGMNHEHARYTIAITATYPGPLRNR
jgi:hypothetical protein